MVIIQEELTGLEVELIDKNSTTVTSIDMWKPLEPNKLVTKQIILVGLSETSEIHFKLWETMENWKVVLAALVDQQKKFVNFWIFRGSRMTKSKTFRLWCQLSMVSYLNFFLFV